MLKICATPNYLPTVKKRFIVHTIHDETRNMEALVKEMTEAGTGLSEADCIAALNSFFKVMSRELARGSIIKLPSVHSTSALQERSTVEGHHNSPVRVMIIPRGVALV